MANAEATTKAPTQNAPAAPGAAEAAAAEAKSDRRSYDVYPDEAKALEAVKGMTKGRCRVFKCTFGGKTQVIGAVHGAAAGFGAYLNAGGTVEEVGAAARGPRAAKPVGVDGIMAAVNALPEAERKAVMDQLKSLAGKK